MGGTRRRFKINIKRKHETELFCFVFFFSKKSRCKINGSFHFLLGRLKVDVYFELTKAKEGENFHAVR